MQRWRDADVTDRQTAFQLYIILAKVPALLCRMGRVPYDRAFGALTDGCVPFNRAFGALIVRSLSMQKSLTKEKSVQF